MPKSSSSKTQRARACQPCRRLKVRCDGIEGSGLPCGSCVRVGQKCVYGASLQGKHEPSKKYASRLETRMIYMYQMLEKHATKDELSRELGFTAPDVDVDQAESPDATPIDPHSHPYFNSAFLEKVGVLHDPTFDWYSFHGHPSDDDSEDLDEEFQQTGDSTRYFGGSSGIPLIATAIEFKEGYSGVSHPNPFHTTEDYMPDFVKSNAWEASLARSKVLPPPDLARKLFDIYFHHINPLMPLIDRPSFEAQYADNLHTQHIRFSNLVHLVWALASTFCPDDSRVYRRHNGVQSPPGFIFFHEVNDEMELLPPATLFDLQARVLTALYHHFIGNVYACWIGITLGFRMAEDVGVHRSGWARQTSLSPVEKESFNRAFWCLLALDRIISSGLGHNVSINEPDFNVSLPTVMSHELDDPKDIIYFVCILKLHEALSRALYLLYSTRPSPWIKRETEASIVSTLEAVLDHWLRTIPHQLRWDPNQTDDILLDQSGDLMNTYYYTVILVHRPLVAKLVNQEVADKVVPWDGAPSADHRQLDICTEAALSSSHIAAVRASRGLLIPPTAHFMVLINGLVLLTGIWGKRKREGSDADVNEWMQGVKRSIASLQAVENRAIMAGRMACAAWDILVELASKADVPVTPTGASPQPIDVDMEAASNLQPLWNANSPSSGLFLTPLDSTPLHRNQPPSLTLNNTLNPPSQVTNPPTLDHDHENPISHLYPVAHWNESVSSSSPTFRDAPRMEQTPYHNLSFWEVDPLDSTHHQLLSRWSSEMQGQDWWQEWGDLLANVSMGS